MEWGDRAVLVLIGIRLGIEGVNPVYYNTIKVSLPPIAFAYCQLTNCADPIYLAPVRWYRWRPPLFLLLLRRLPG